MSEQNILQKIEGFVDSAESTAVDLVARLSPWLAPLPTAYLTATATVKHLSWPTQMGAVAGVVIESLGLASVSTALELREYNATKRKSDPTAPFGLSVALAGVYFGAVTSLTVALDTIPSMATFAPLAFPILSLAGVTVLAIRRDHRRRIEAIAQQKAERRATRATRKSAQKDRPARAQRVHQGDAPEVQSSAQNGAQNGALDAVNRTRQERKAGLLSALVDAYQGDPELGATAAARLLKVHRNTIYSYTAELEQAGRISRDNGTVKVLEVTA